MKGCLGCAGLRSVWGQTPVTHQQDPGGQQPLCPYSPGLSSGDLLTGWGTGTAAAQPNSRCHTSHRLQLELSGFLRTHHVMNLAEHLIKSTNAADASVAATSSSPALCPCGLRLCVSVVDSFNLRLLLCAALRGPCRRSDRAGPPHTHSPNLALHPRVLQEHV